MVRAEAPHVEGPEVVFRLAGEDPVRERCVESYHRYYRIHWPVEEMRSGRGGRRSPLYTALKEARAVFGSRFGWERPNWFAAEREAPRDVPSFEGRPSWFAAVAREAKAIRERVVLIDQSSFAKYEIAGPGAFAFLQRIAANDVAKPPGALVYTQLCNARGCSRSAANQFGRSQPKREPNTARASFSAVYNGERRPPRPERISSTGQWMR